MFPRLKNRGPIEANRRGPGIPPAFGFPRLKNRGPIEAPHHPSHTGRHDEVSAVEKPLPH